MQVRFMPPLDEKVLELARKYDFTPDEVVSIGVALAKVILEAKEQDKENRVIVVSPKGEELAEFKEPEPRAIRAMAERYVQSVSNGEPVTSVSKLVAKLERERDESGEKPRSL